MTEDMKKLLRAGKRDKEFLLAIKAADNDKAPGMFASKMHKSIFISTYYGYLIAKHGDKWRNKI